MNKGLAAGIALIVGSGVTGWLALRGSAKHDAIVPRAKAAEAPLASLREGSARRAAKPSPNSSVALVPSLGTSSALPQGQDPPEDTTLGDDTVLVNDQRMSREELTFRLETKFRDQGPSDRGGRDLEHRISDQFVGEAALRATLNAAECRSQLCRIDLTAGDKYAASKAFEGLYRGALLSAGAALGPSYETLPDGRVRLVIYAARQGEIDVL
jgi:hypothetical protein